MEESCRLSLTIYYDYHKELTAANQQGELSPLSYYMPLCYSDVDEILLQLSPLHYIANQANQ